MEATANGRGVAEMMWSHDGAPWKSNETPKSDDESYHHCSPPTLSRQRRYAKYNVSWAAEFACRPCSPPSLIIPHQFMSSRLQGEKEGSQLWTNLMVTLCYLEMQFDLPRSVRRQLSFLITVLLTPPLQCAASSNPRHTKIFQIHEFPNFLSHCLCLPFTHPRGLHGHNAKHHIISWYVLVTNIGRRSIIMSPRMGI